MGNPEADDAEQKSESEPGTDPVSEGPAGDEPMDLDMMIASFPVGRLVSFGVPQDKVDELIELARS